MLKLPEQNVRDRRANHNRQDLEHILEELSPRAIAAKLEVSEITVARWINQESRVPKAAIIALNAILGRLPGMDCKLWNGAWINRDGTIGLNGHTKTYHPESIYMLEYGQRQLESAVEGYRRRIDELEAKLALLTRGSVDGAANDGDLSVDLAANVEVVANARRYRVATQQFWEADREYKKRIGWRR